MGSHRLNRKVSLAAALTVFSLGFAHYAGAVTRPVVPDTTTEWGNEVVRVTDDGGGSPAVQLRAVPSGLRRLPQAS